MLRYFLVLCTASLLWAQASVDEQLKAKQDAERLHRGTNTVAGAVAADSATAREQKRAAETMHFALSAAGASGPLVRNKPYRAEAITETVQPLIDGNRIIRTNTTKQYRDRAGRTRREQTIQNVSVAQFVVITDPVAKFDYIVDAARKTVRKFPHLESALANVRANETNLGTRMIEGLECAGTRKVVTLPAGQVGNVLPIETVTETWYAPAIEALVRSTSADPRFGKTTYTLRNVVLDEPARSLFEPPPGYQLEFEARPGTTMNRVDRP